MNTNFALICIMLFFGYCVAANFYFAELDGNNVPGDYSRTGIKNHCLTV